MPREPQTTQRTSEFEGIKRCKHGLCVCRACGWDVEFVPSDDPAERRRQTHNYRKRIRPWKRQAAYRRDGYRCVRCGSNEDLSLDHRVAIKDGGTNRIDNLQTMCRTCNTEKN